MSAPINMVKTSGVVSMFSDQDSYIENVMSTFSKKLLSTTQVYFFNNHAYQALNMIFNLHKLKREDYLELNTLKILSLRFQFNNGQLEDIQKLLPKHSRQFLDRGVQFELKAEVKEQCEADIFCIILSKFYGKMFSLSLKGAMAESDMHLKLQSPMADMIFSPKFSMTNCSLVFELDYT